MATPRKNPFKVGDRFRATVSGNGYVAGTEYICNGINGITQVCGTYNGTNIGQWILTSQVSKCGSTKADLTKEKDIIQKQIEEINSKLAFMNLNGLEEYDEEEYKIFHALEILDRTENRMEKAKQLAKLMREFA
jgi:hypothetical protein